MIAFIGASTRNGTILQSFVREIGHSFKRLDDTELCIKARLVESIVPTTRWNVYKTIVTRSILLSLLSQGNSSQGESAFFYTASK